MTFRAVLCSPCLHLSERMYLYLSCAFFKNASSRPRYYLPRCSLIVVESGPFYYSTSQARPYAYHSCSSDKRARDWSFRRFSLRTQKRGRLNDQRQVTDTVIFRKRTRPTMKEPPAGSQVNKPAVRPVPRYSKAQLGSRPQVRRTHSLSSAQLGAAARPPGSAAYKTLNMSRLSVRVPRSKSSVESSIPTPFASVQLLLLLLLLQRSLCPFLTTTAATRQ